MLFEAYAQKEFICGSYSIVTGFTEKSKKLICFLLAWEVSLYS